MKKQAEPLYRKNNTKSLRTKYYVKPQRKFRQDRNKKATLEFEGNTMPMKKRGNYNKRDYTPLFMFLISGVGKDADVVYSEAKKRSDHEFQRIWNVMFSGEEIIRWGEGSHYHGLMVDEDGKIQKVNSEATLKDSFEVMGFTSSLNGKAQKLKKY